MQADLRIQVSDLHIKNEAFTVSEMVALAEQQLNIQDRVPNVQGDAFDSRSGIETGRASRNEGMLKSLRI